jgi:hypothetical protein
LIGKARSAISFAECFLQLAVVSSFSSVRNDRNAPSPVVEKSMGRARFEALVKAISRFAESIALNLVGPVPYSKMTDSPMPAQDYLIAFNQHFR